MRSHADFAISAVAIIAAVAFSRPSMQAQSTPGLLTAETLRDAHPESTGGDVNSEKTTSRFL
jgi:hypothetical protein